jgi:hypothetical protein
VFGTPNPRSKIGWKYLAREYELPRWVTAPVNTNNTWDVPVRPGEQARLEFELSGGMDTPVLTVNGHTLRFPVTLKSGHKLICPGQRRWVIFDAKRTQVAEGDLAAASPILKGGLNWVSFACGAPDRAMVKFVKVYEP